MDAARPRFFWRRLAALVVDNALAVCVTLLLLLPFLDSDAGALRLSGLFNSKVCYEQTQLPKEFHDLVAPSAIASAQLCKHRANGFANGWTVAMTYDVQVDTTGAVTQRSFRTLEVPTTSEGEIISRVYAPQTVLNVVLIIVVSAVLLKTGRQSPGKRLFGVQVVGTGAPWRREILRLGPFVLLETGTFLMAFVPVDQLVGVPTTALLGISGVLALTFALWYVLPLLRWRGAMPWDRYAGFDGVERA